MQRQNRKEALSREAKSEKAQALDRMIEKLIAYCGTEEGIELADRIGELLDRIKGNKSILLKGSA